MKNSSTTLVERDFVENVESRRSSPIQEQLLFTSLLGQVMAGISFGILSSGSLRHHFPWWGITLVAGGLLVLVYIISGLGKWEAPAIVSIGSMQDLAWHDLSWGLAVIFCISLLVSFLSYLAGAFKKRDELSATVKLLRAILTPIVLVEIGILIAGIMFAVWFMFAWSSSANFG